MTALQPAEVESIVKALLSRSTAFHEAIIHYRGLCNTKAEKDPRIGDYLDNGEPAPTNPFANLTKVQSTILWEVASKTVDRLTENPAEPDCTGPRDEAGWNDKAAKVNSILTTWFDDIQRRNGINWQETMSWAQVREPYAVLHTRRAEEVYGDLSRRYRDKVEMDDAGLYEENDDDEPEKRARGKYRERAGVYGERRARAVAMAGAGWHVEFVDSAAFVPLFDRHPRGGMGMALVSYEMYLLDYQQAARDSTKDTATALYQLNRKLDVGQETPAPGISQALGTSGQVHDEPSTTTGDGNRRIHVYCLWTRDEYYEATDSGSAGGFEVVKKFSHDMGEVPFRLVPARDTGATEPIYRWPPYLWSGYMTIEAANEFFTMANAQMQLGILPMFLRKLSGDKRPPLLPDGLPESTETDSEGAGTIPAGTDIVPFQVEFSPGTAAGMQWWVERLRESMPESGRFEIESSSKPWTARQGIAQANIGPRNLMKQQVEGLEWMVGLWLKWHRNHPEEPLTAFSRDGERVDKSSVLSVTSEDLDLISPGVRIDATSMAERITNTEHELSLLERQLTTPIEFYEVRGEKDPQDHLLSVMAFWDAYPHVRRHNNQMMAQRMGTRFVAGTNGESIGPDGQPATPYQVAQAFGVTPAAPQVPQNGQVMPQTTSMPGSMAALSAPGTITLPGSPGVG